MAFEAQIAALRNVSTMTEAIIKDEVEKRSAVLIADVSAQIYEKGMAHTGKKIKNLHTGKPKYTARYQKYKTKLDLYQGHIDLNLSGEWHKSLILETDEEEFKIYGTKTIGEFDLSEWLRYWFPDAEGLTDKNVNRLLNEYIKPRLIEELKKAL